MVKQNKKTNCAINKILIIDDDRELCALIKHSVQSEHIEADFCNTKKKGLQKLKEQEYQLVVLDVMMPGVRMERRINPQSRLVTMATATDITAASFRLTDT